MTSTRARLGLFGLALLFVGCTSVLGTFEVGGAPASGDAGATGTDAGTGTTPTEDAATPTGSFELSVTKSGQGGGAVGSIPAGIQCGPKCSESFPAGTKVELRALPGQNSNFKRWGGDCSGAADVCTLTMTKAMTVDAVFEPQPGAPLHTLTVQKTGDGTVTSVAGIDCGAVCAKDFVAGTTVSLRAIPAAGQVFVGWRDACLGPDPACDVLVDGPKTAQALFAPAATWDTAWSLAGLTYTPNALGVTNSTGSTKNARTNVGRAQGKFYWEVKVLQGTTAVNGGGVGLVNAMLPNNVQYIGAAGPAAGISFGYGSNPSYFMNWPNASTGGAPPTSSYMAAGVVYMFALDVDNGRAWFGNNGVWYNAGDPATDTNPAVKGLSGMIYPAVTLYGMNGSHQLEANFGASAFVYQPPKGFARGFF